MLLCHHMNILSCGDFGGDTERENFGSGFWYVSEYLSDRASAHKSGDLQFKSQFRYNFSLKYINLGPSDG